jgi:hypothetical protein
MSSGVRLFSEDPQVGMQEKSKKQTFDGASPQLS